MTDDQTPTRRDEEDAPASDPIVGEGGQDVPGDTVGPAGELLEVSDIEAPAEFDVVDDEAEELAGPDIVDETPDAADPGDVVIDDETQLAEAEQVAAAAVSSRPVKRDAPARRNAPVKRVPVDKSAEGIRTRSRAEATLVVTHARKRTTPGEFVGQSVGELRKVIWPTADQLRQYFIVVLIFVLFIMAFVGLLDLLFGWGLLKLLGM
ncbi:MAG TPA: preprotein translocase subunit SecE [Propionibacteriaceae bacterium]|nr:preprotein translocase subunit SecE [Propionibacteriaceae bacterium]